MCQGDSEKEESFFLIYQDIDRWKEAAVKCSSNKVRKILSIAASSPQSKDFSGRDRKKNEFYYVFT